MSKKRRHLKSPWNNIQSAIWMIGIAILFIYGNWWPGILFVIAASLIAEAVIPLLIPGAVQDEPEAALPPAPPAPTFNAPPVSSAPPEPAAPTYRPDLLPAVCPACGARVRASEVRWVSERSADCAYCASPLMGTAKTE